MERAGLHANHSGNPVPRFEHGACVRAVAQAWREMERPPEVRRYDEWRAGRSALPSSATVRRAGGSWNDLLVAAYPLVHDGEARNGPGRRVADGGALPNRSHCTSP